MVIEPGAGGKNVAPMEAVLAAGANPLPVQCLHCCPHATFLPVPLARTALACSSTLRLSPPLQMGPLRCQAHRCISASSVCSVTTLQQR